METYIICKTDKVFSHDDFFYKKGMTISLDNSMEIVRDNLHDIVEAKEAMKEASSFAILVDEKISFYEHSLWKITNGGSKELLVVSPVRSPNPGLISEALKCTPSALLKSLYREYVNSKLDLCFNTEKYYREFTHKVTQYHEKLLDCGSNGFNVWLQHKIENNDLTFSELCGTEDSLCLEKKD